MGVEWYVVLLDMKLSKISLSPMSQSVTLTKSSPFGPAISEQSLWSLKETAGSEPTGLPLMVCYVPGKVRMADNIAGTGLFTDTENGWKFY